jgi:hypothetical protein
MKTLRELLVDLAGDVDADDEELEECLRECGDVVWDGNEDEHRWRIEYEVVAKFMDGDKVRYFKYSACKGTNDNSWEDAGYDFEGIDKVYEVFPKEIVTTVYVANP